MAGGINLGAAWRMAQPSAVLKTEAMLKIREFADTGGVLSAIYLIHAEGGLRIGNQAASVALPDNALGVVMARYGAPFDPDAPIADVAALALGGGRTLRHVRHLAGYDVIARDYLVYEGPGLTPLCALSTTVARALEHLASVLPARARAHRPSRP
jgi:hypothetical protein